MCCDVNNFQINIGETKIIYSLKNGKKNLEAFN